MSDDSSLDQSSIGTSPPSSLPSLEDLDSSNFNNMGGTRREVECEPSHLFNLEPAMEIEYHPQSDPTFNTHYPSLPVAATHHMDLGYAYNAGAAAFASTDDSSLRFTADSQPVDTFPTSQLPSLENLNSEDLNMESSTRAVDLDLNSSMDPEPATKTAHLQTMQMQEYHTHNHPPSNAPYPSIPVAVHGSLPYALHPGFAFAGNEAMLANAPNGGIMHVTVQVPRNLNPVSAPTTAILQTMQWPVFCLAENIMIPTSMVHFSGVPITNEQIAFANQNNLMPGPTLLRSLPHQVGTVLNTAATNNPFRHFFQNEQRTPRTPIVPYRKKDVCFGLIKNPGTVAWRKMVNYLAIYGNQDWSDDVHQTVKAQMETEGRHFLIHIPLINSDGSQSKELTNCQWRYATDDKIKVKTEQRFRDKRRPNTAVQF